MAEKLPLRRLGARLVRLCFRRLGSPRARRFFCHTTGIASCTACSLPVDPVDLLRADLIKSDFHAGCFTCTKCEEPLAHHAYYAYHRQPFCGRCHAEKFYPRCSGCDEVRIWGAHVVAYGGLLFLK